MKKANYYLLLFVTFAVSCQNDDIPAPATPDAYMSLTTGSTWNYEVVNNLTTNTSTYTLTATSKDSAIGGKTYRVVTNSSGSGNEYYNITGNDYNNFRKLPTALGSSNVVFNYLKDNAAIGTSWVQAYPVTVSGVSLNATLTNTVTQKGISKTVKGIAYKDVIQVNTAIAVSIGPLPLPAGALTSDIQSFYAPKVGLIQTVNKVNLNYAGITDNTDQLTNLVSATIK